jgi:hypothetical protein
VISEQQSAVYDVRDTFFNAVTADAFFAGYTARKTRMVPVPPEAIPFLGVYVVDESHTPDGDANAGCIRFSHTARIGFSVVIVNNDQAAAEQLLDQAFLAIMRILFTDYSMFNPIIHPNNVENVTIESVVRGGRRFNFAPQATNNETPYAELQYEVSVFFRSEWYPDIWNYLEQMWVTTGMEAWSTPTERQMREQVTVAYFFAQPKDEPATTKGNDNGQRANADGTIEKRQGIVDRREADAGAHVAGDEIEPAGNDQS